MIQKFILGFGILAWAASAGATVFTIHEGDHYSTPRMLRLFSGTRMDLSVQFDESALYQFTGAAAADQGDTNKLYGFSDCLDSHMENSARFGWRDVGGQIEIRAFTHKDGKFSSVPIKFIEPNHIYSASISLSPDRRSYLYEFDGTQVTMERGCEQDRARGYHLQPYFGGNQAAPHEVRIRVNSSGALAPVLADFPYSNPMTGAGFKMRIHAFQSVAFFVRIYDVLGNLVWESSKESFSGEFKGEMSYQVDRYLPPGTYFVAPYGITPEGEVLRAGVNTRNSGDVYHLVVQR
jgi:hypothetical protein